MIARVQRNGREVLETRSGVQIGLLYEPRSQQQGSQADIVQRLFMTPVPRVWHQTPKHFHVSPSIFQRIRGLLK